MTKFNFNYEVTMGAPKGHPNYDTEHKAGRPVIYDDAFIERECDALEKWLHDEDNEMFFLNEFIFKRRYSKQRISEFCEKNKRYSELVKIAKERQENKLIQGALTRTFDAGFTKFLMPRLCGDHWQEVRNIKVTSNGPVTDLIGEIDGDSKDLINDKKVRKS
jgi:hypothetical protein